jgi:hypothetical protein
MLGIYAFNRSTVVGRSPEQPLKQTDSVRQLYIKQHGSFVEQSGK